MIKTNQFVNVLAGGVYLSRLLLVSQIPIVTMDREKAGRFKEHVLTVSLYDKSWWTDDFTTILMERADDDFDADKHLHEPGEDGVNFRFLIAGRDWPAFCTVLDHAYEFIPLFGRDTYIDLYFPKWDELNFRTWDGEETRGSNLVSFLDNLPASLLKPFRKLRDLPYVGIRGTTSLELTQAVKEEVRCPEFSDRKDVIRCLDEFQETGAKYQQSGAKLMAASEFFNALATICRTLNRDPFDGEFSHDPAFLSYLAETYFTMLLRGIDNVLGYMTTCSDRQTMLQLSAILDGEARRSKSCLRDFRERNSLAWQSDDVLRAQLEYRFAVTRRLLGFTNPREVSHVLSILDGVRETIPGNVDIEAEYEKVKWMRHEMFKKASFIYAES
jgi:hypothetical protein